MKYAYITMIVLCLLTSTSWSLSNPMIRNCRLAGGEFTVVEIQKSSTNKYDQWALCKFDQAYVGALDVMLFNSKESNPTSFTEYSKEATRCTGFIEVVNILNSDEQFLICKYSDSSIIDFKTLKLGRYNSANQKLNSYLGL